VPPPGQPAGDWLDRPAGLLRVLRPVLVLIGVPIAAVALETATATAVFESIAYHLLIGPQTTDTPGLVSPYGLFRALSLLAGPAVVLVVARWAGRREPLLAAAVPSVRAVAVPMLLAVGAGISYDRPYGARTGSEHAPSTAAAAVVAWTIVVVALGLWLARMPSRPRTVVRVVAVTAVVSAFVVATLAGLTGQHRSDPLVVALVAATVFALSCAPPATSSSAAAAQPVASSGPPAGFAGGVGAVRWVGLGCGVAGAAIVAVTLVPELTALTGRDSREWAGWLDGVRQAAAVLAVLGLLLAAVTWSPARAPGERRRKAAAGVAIIAAYCPPGLFAQGRWNVITEPAPDELAVATAAVTGLLAALATAAAVAARQAPLRARTAAVLIAAFGLGSAAIGAASNGDSDTNMVVLLAALVGQISGIVLILVVWRIARGRPRHRLRRTLTWAGVWLAALSVGGTGFLDSVAVYVSQFGASAPGSASVVGTLVVAVAMAVLLNGRMIRARRAPAGPRPSVPDAALT
jgi:hypothetical protein